jgi:hypothetical protein
MDLSTALSFTAFQESIQDVLVVAVPVGLGLIALSVGYRWVKTFAKSR